MNELIPTSVNHLTTFNFKNAALNQAASEIAAMGNDVSTKQRGIAKVLGRVLQEQSYTEDNFKSVGDFAEKTFGIKKASAYQLANIGRRFLCDYTDKELNLINCNRELSPLESDIVNQFLSLPLSVLAEFVNLSDLQILAAARDGVLSLPISQKDARDVVKTIKQRYDTNGETVNIAEVVKPEKQYEFH